MKVAFLIEYFPPYATGGSEWSTYYLAQQLAKAKTNVVVVTPNYGQKKLKGKTNFKIVKFPFYKKIKNSHLPGNFFYTNPLWILWTAVAFYYYVKSEKIDVIHVQGKYSLPGARLANLLLKKPLIVTLRDYQPICNYGFCLYHKNKGCTPAEYFSSDFHTYYQEYVQDKNPINYSLNLLFAIWGRLAKNILTQAARNTKIVVLSKYQQNVYLANGFKNITVIGNSIVPAKTPKVTKKDQLVYVGRLTPGKGLNLLISIIPNLCKKYPQYQILLIGSGFLKGKLKAITIKLSNVKLLDQLDHQQVLKILEESKLSIIPSVWPEPFGRVVAESLMCNTPVVVTNRGALSELVNKRWGVVTQASPQALLMGIKNGLANNHKYETNIYADRKLLLETFVTSTPKKYSKLYEEVTK